MINLILRKHPVDTEMLEVIKRSEVHLMGVHRQTVTTAWALVNTDMVYEDEEIRAALKLCGVVEIELRMKGSGE